MKKYRKSLSVKGFPLNATILFDLTFGVDSHQSGIATLHVRLEIEDPQAWAGYGVTPPSLETEHDFEINASGTQEQIQKFVRTMEKTAQDELDKLCSQATIGSNFAKGVQSVFMAGQYTEA